MWLSTDPALGEYIPGLDKDKNGNLPGMGGLLNQINANLFHAMGNNPVKFVDPDGRVDFASPEFLSKAFEVARNVSELDGDYYYCDVVSLLIIFVCGLEYLDANATLAIKNHLSNQGKETPKSKVPGKDAIPEEDKDKIAQHAHDDPMHGPSLDLDDPSEKGIRKKIDDVLSNPNTISKKGRHGQTLYMDPDGNALIYNPAAPDKGTIFYPSEVGPEYYWEHF